MDEEYTPDTDAIKLAYALSCDDRKYPAMDSAAWDAIKKEAFAAFDRWLAAHDAEVRDKALSLPDDELIIAESEYESSIMEYEGDGLGAMSIALKAVAEDRRRQ